MLERAEHRRRTSGEGTIFFLDEIHRFNKAQQDALLPAVEEGLVALVGRDHREPLLRGQLGAALSLHRVRVPRARGRARARAAAPRARPTSAACRTPPPVDDEALEFLAARAGGDARMALAALDVACETAGGDPVTLRHAEDALQRKALLYDKGGDRHYDTISAWIKATRGSDPDASMLYLVEMLEGGEDPRFIARRMVVLASEDIGNADPRALEVAVAAAHAVEHVGMPECAFNLAQAAIYLALAPKSDTVKRALGAHRRLGGGERRARAARLPEAAPPTLAPGRWAAARATTIRTRASEGVSPQELMPPEAAGERFVELTERGDEATLGARLEEIRRYAAARPQRSAVGRQRSSSQGPAHPARRRPSRTACSAPAMAISASAKRAIVRRSGVRRRAASSSAAATSNLGRQRGVGGPARPLVREQQRLAGEGAGEHGHRERALQHARPSRQTAPARPNSAPAGSATAPQANASGTA